MYLGKLHPVFDIAALDCLEARVGDQIGRVRPEILLPVGGIEGIGILGNGDVP